MNGDNVDMELYVIFTMLIYIGIILLGVYLMISAILFFKDKSKNDKELLQKLDEIIKAISQQSDKTL